MYMLRVIENESKVSTDVKYGCGRYRGKGRLLLNPEPRALRCVVYTGHLAGTKEGKHDMDANGEFLAVSGLAIGIEV